ncbi:hypothetical protein DI396_03845 [Litorivita pollutaquae]|uniref:Uncharacterized protein n=1 Tax=Litorivita pollutaquae TaxID=2200892 RepID=A0A2V4NGI2_9RHOB|nr:hypothetical protein A9Q95_08470 [Rhodobacterales bacterium 59_46_T64]PYC49180.1 hypothetical protein DI396_03845 [Litorivita pollutaquae]
MSGARFAGFAPVPGVGGRCLVRAGFYRNGRGAPHVRAGAWGGQAGDAPIHTPMQDLGAKAR